MTDNQQPTPDRKTLVAARARKRVQRRAKERAESKPEEVFSEVLTSGPEPDAKLADVRLLVGTIIGVHGFEGEMRMRISTDDPMHLRNVKRVFVGDEPVSRRLMSLRFHGGVGLIHLSEIKTEVAAKELVGCEVRISGRDARPLQPGEYYHYQLIGLEVFDPEGARLGKVVAMMATGANDVLEILQDDGKTMLLPFIPSVVLEISPSEKRMLVQPLVYREPGEQSQSADR